MKNEIDCEWSLQTNDMLIHYQIHRLRIKGEALMSLTRKACSHFGRRMNIERARWKPL